MLTYLLFLGTFKYSSFDRYPQTWIGEWEKAGHQASTGMDSYLLECNYCSNPDMPVGRSKLRSYRVIGVTKPEAFWDWQTGFCTNPNRCWGPKVRKWTVLKSSSEDWIFRSHVSDPSQPHSNNLVDEIKIKLKQGNGDDRLVYSGIASADHIRCFFPMLDEPKMYWPDSIPYKKMSKPYRKVTLRMASGLPLPPDSGINRQMNIEYMFPNYIKICIFEQEKIRLRSGALQDPKVS